MTDHAAPSRATPSLARAYVPSRDTHREIFARFVDRLAARLGRDRLRRRA